MACSTALSKRNLSFAEFVMFPDLRRLLFLSLLFCWFGLRAQVDVRTQSPALDIVMDGTEEGKQLSTVLLDIESKRNVRFFFRDEWVSGITITKNYSGRSLGSMLDELFADTHLYYIAIYPEIIVILRDATDAIAHRNAVERALSERRTLEQRDFGSDKDFVKGRRVTISGTVIDTKTGDAMSGASVTISESQLGTTTNELGKYALIVDQGNYVISFAFLDYEEKLINVSAFKDATIDISMNEVARYLEEVVVTDRANREVATSRLGQTQLTIKDLRRVPAMLGEVDLIRNVQMLPGVTTVGEAAPGFSVRGGSVDQNLVQYDGMPMYNSSHVFGFLSTFNPEAIRDVSFYRGGIPAEFGGRSSSVLDIRAGDGDFEKWNGNVGIGLITANGMINGPLSKGNTSMLASFRSTYSDWLIHSIKSNYGNLKESSVFFYDATVKLTHKVGPRTKLTATGYSSTDAFKLIGDSTYRWSNALASVRLDHQFASGLTGEFILGESIYSYDLTYGKITNATQLSFNIASTVGKAGFHYQLGKHKLDFGWQGTYYHLNPGSQKPSSSESTARNIALNRQNSIESALYASDTWSPADRWFLEAGLRLPLFTSLGPATINTYASETHTIGNVTDTVAYGVLEPIKTYVGIEPRLSARWMLGKAASIKAGYSRVFQYLHLVSNSTAVSPIDIWQPSGPYFKPQVSDQVSLGYFVDLKENKYALSAEGFYKLLGNVVDYKDGAQLIMNSHIETELLQGKGWSYGVETSVAKKTGAFTGSVNYTFARSFRKFAGQASEESINAGNVFPSNFDQPHIVNVSWQLNLTKRYFFTGNFTYHTGRPVTIPLAMINSDNIPVAYYSDRNQYRIPDYHRLDLALVIEGNHRRKKIGDGTWVFSIYNVYARRNVYTVFFRTGSDGVPKPYSLSVIGTVLPSISYNFRF